MTVLAGLPDDTGAKTGIAEVGGDQPNNGRLAAHRGNVAIACLVEGAKPVPGPSAPSSTSSSPHQ